MNKENIIEKEGVVETTYPNAVFDVRLEDDSLNGHMIKATLAGRLRKHRISILPGDKVKVEISVYDLDKGRITYRK